MTPPFQLASVLWCRIAQQQFSETKTTILGVLSFGQHESCNPTATTFFSCRSSFVRAKWLVFDPKYSPPAYLTCRCLYLFMVLCATNCCLLFPAYNSKNLHAAAQCLCMAGGLWLRLNHMPYVVRNSHLHALVNKPSLLQIIIAAAFNDHVQFAGNGQAITACSG